jgi:hypothetical protein
MAKITATIGRKNSSPLQAIVMFEDEDDFMPSEKARRFAYRLLAAADKADEMMAEHNRKQAMKINIFLDDIRLPPDDGLEWVVVKTAWQCIALLGRNPNNVKYLSLDHDLGDMLDDKGRVCSRTDRHDWGTGYDVAKWLEGCHAAGKHCYLPEVPLVHSANPVGRKNIWRALERVYKMDSRF